MRGATQVSRASSYDHDERQENEVKIGSPFSMASFDARSEYMRMATQNREALDSQDRLTNNAHKKLNKSYPERNSYLESHTASDWDTRFRYGSSRGRNAGRR